MTLGTNGYSFANDIVGVQLDRRSMLLFRSKNIGMISDGCLVIYDSCMLFILGILGAIVGGLIFLVLFVTVVVVAVKR